MIYCAAGTLAGDYDFEPLIEAAVEQYGIPLAQIATGLLWGADTEQWVNHGHLKVLCPLGQPSSKVEELVKDRKHIALLLQTGPGNIGEFEACIDDKWESLADDLSDNQTTITDDISVLNAVLTDILDRCDALEAEGEETGP